jgi:hypothetical protein
MLPMKTRIAITFLLALLMNLRLSAITFYIDSQLGNDSNPGTHNLPFQTIEKVNSLKLQPGDTILFAGGQTFAGNLRLTNLAGTQEQPVLIGTFGSGWATLEGGSEIAIQVTGCSWLQIKNLVLSGNGRLSNNRGSGLELRNTQNCLIDSIEARGFFWSGIKAVGGKNLRITHVYAHDNGFAGINVESDGQNAGGLEGSGQKTFRNLYIAHCVAENNPGCPEVKENHSGNGILIGGVTNGMIEYCEAMKNGWDMPRDGNGPVGIWAYQSDSITIQHCYSHDNQTSQNGKDGGGFDFDGGVTNSIMQFNFSANNEGAGYGLFQYYGASVWKNNIIRNNISYNDGRKNGQAGFLMWIANGSPEIMSDCEIYENTVVNCYGFAVNFEPGHYPGFNFRNNQFQITGNAEIPIGGDYTGATFENNLIWSSNQKVQSTFPENSPITGPPVDKKIIQPNATEKPKNEIQP